ncbi:hypothetical protein K250101E9_20000 [Enterocloster aldenensis]
MLTLFFAAAGLLKLLPYYSSMPIMFVFFGLSLEIYLSPDWPVQNAAWMACPCPIDEMP